MNFRQIIVHLDKFFTPLSRTMYSKSLFRYTFFTTSCIAILIFLGGLVNSTGSGLSVPDWPTTFGENMFTYPPSKWIGGVKYEHGHRLFASFVGMLTIGLVIFMWKKESRKWVRLLAYYALFIVILQGVLGGVTVLLKLPPIVSIFHGMLAQAYFCLVAALALFTSPWWFQQFSSEEILYAKKYFKLSLIAVGIVFLQLFFGALLRHTHSGLAIPDFPLSYGQIFPSLTPDSLHSYNNQLIADGIKHPAERPVMAYQIIIHFIHRTWAYIVTGFLLFLGMKGIQSLLPRKTTLIVKLILGLILLQFILGVFTVLTQKNFLVATFHVFIGAGVLMFTVLFALQLGKISHQESSM